MATGKKRASGTKKAQTGKREGAGHKGAAAAGQEDSFTREVILWIIVAVSLLLFLSNFGIGGAVGNAVSRFFFGVFGLIAYVFPAALLIGTFFAVANHGNRIAVVKLVASVLLVVFLCMFFELLRSGKEADAAVAAFEYGFENKLGGGMIGGALAWLCSRSFGVIGAYVIDIVVLIISLVLITERSALKGMQKGGKKVYESAKVTNERHRERAMQRREEREQRREEQSLRRMDRKVSGVAMDTRILPEQSAAPSAPCETYRSDEISEINMEQFLDIPEVREEKRVKLTAGSITEIGKVHKSRSRAEYMPQAERAQTVRQIKPVEYPFPPQPGLADLPSGEESGQPAGFTVSVSANGLTEHVPLSALGGEARQQRAAENSGPAEGYAELPAPEERCAEPLTPEETAEGYAELPAPEGCAELYAPEETAEGCAELYAPEDAADEGDKRASAWNMEEGVAEQLAVPEGSVEEAAGGLWQEAVREQTNGQEETQAKECRRDTLPGRSSGAGGATDRPQEMPGAGGDAPPKPYVFPPLELLKRSEKKAGDSRQYLQETAMKLQQTLKNFGVSVTLTNISCGPAVTRYELQPEMGVKVSKIVNLADDIKLNLAATDIRIEAPIPGKAAVGIEVPNRENVMVSFRELAESEEFQAHASRISFCVGKDIAGRVVVSDIAKMPHLLIAGSTGSGKSVCINTIVMSILYKADPKDVRLIMVDPKVVELSIYNGIPHLMIPVVTDPQKAAGALRWAVAEMDDRYQKFAAAGVRDLKGYNAKIDALPDIDGDPKPEKLPQIVIIVDELADLMMVAAKDVEESICRLAQLARACGIHLIIATQRPSVNVITGLIKANMPSRIAFAVTSGIDSRTILDMNGAEKLLGKGDMLFHPQGVPKPVRVQGAFVSDREVSDVAGFIREHNSAGSYNADMEEKIRACDSANTTTSIDSGAAGGGDSRDSYFAEAAKLLMDKEKGSIGMLQRYFKIGFNRAARIMDQLEEAGIVGPEEGTKPRRILMTPEQFEQYMEEYL